LVVHPNYFFKVYTSQVVRRIFFHQQYLKLPKNFVRYWEAYFKKRDYTEAYEHLGTIFGRSGSF